MLNSVFDGLVVCVTGGTGTFGSAFVEKLLKYTDVKKIIIFSRDEMKQWAMRQRPEFQDDRLRFFLGDVRDSSRLARAFCSVDIVVHAAANKIVDSCERDPQECVKTNILGAINVIETALDLEIPRVVALSTDKASSPVNLYGASKLVSDKLFMNAGVYVGSKVTKFSVVRYGNVIASRGSVIPVFCRQRREGRSISITDERMTRFLIDVDQAVEVVVHACCHGAGGDLYVPKLPSARIVDLASALAPESERIVTGRGVGEKIHEELVGNSDADCCFDIGDYYVLCSPISNPRLYSELASQGLKVDPDFALHSGQERWILSQDDLKHRLSTWIE